MWWNDRAGLLIETERHRAFVENNGSVHALVGPGGQPVIRLHSAAFDAGGQLWTVLGNELWRRDTASRWTRVPASHYGHEQPRRLSSLAHGIVLITDKGAWYFDSAARSRLLLHAPELFAAAGGGDHPLWLVTHGNGYLWREEHGHFVKITKVGGRVLDMRYRGNTLWVSADRFLLAVAADNSISALDINHGLPSGGPLLVDHEGSLWVGTFVGLQQYPEPDTKRCTELDGLPWQHTFDVVAADGQVWVNTWGGTVRYDLHGSIPAMVRMKSAAGVLCADQDGRMWQAVNDWLAYWKQGHYVHTDFHGDKPLSMQGCVPARDGGVWLTTNLGVFYVPRHSRHAYRVIVPKGANNEKFTSLSWQQSDDTLWAMASGRICRYRLNGLQVHLRYCTQQPFENGFFRVVKIAPDRYWLSTDAGLFLFDGKQAHLLAGNQLLPGRRFRTIKPAASGGYWGVGPGVLERIKPCNDCAAGFKVLETIGAWQGVPTDSALDVVELASGDLWIAGNRGVFHVPASVRPGPQAPPPLMLEGVNVDGKDQALDEALRVQPDQQQVSIEFAALTYRDCSLLRYRFRNNETGSWSVPSRNPALQFIQPGYGTYHVEAQASLDGVHWSAPVAYEFSVAPHWYETVWALAVLLLIIIAVFLLAGRLWIEHKLRLERQRVRIAMDLHDEIGSTLGSIGMLVGAMAFEENSTPEQRRLLNSVTDTVARLGSALRTVVWSMRQPTADMSQLLTEMGDQAKRLFPTEPPQVKVNSSGNLAGVQINSLMRRHVLMIALEAMHNVARHAHADQVVLQLLKQEAGGWRLEVRDDGVGFDLHASLSGSGVENMRRQARLIQASLSLYSRPGAGTTITLEFWPAGRRQE